MTIKLGVVMDPISQVKVKKDSSMAMMLEHKNAATSFIT